MKIDTIIELCDKLTSQTFTDFHLRLMKEIGGQDLFYVVDELNKIRTLSTELKAEMEAKNKVVNILVSRVEGYHLGLKDDVQYHLEQLLQGGDTDE